MTDIVFNSGFIGFLIWLYSLHLDIAKILVYLFRVQGKIDSAVEKRRLAECV